MDGSLPYSDPLVNSGKLIVFYATCISVANNKLLPYSDPLVNSGYRNQIGYEPRPSAGVNSLPLQLSTREKEVQDERIPGHN
jgi:hypothetical protein